MASFDKPSGDDTAQWEEGCRAGLAEWNAAQARLAAPTTSSTTTPAVSLPPGFPSQLQLPSGFYPIEVQPYPPDGSIGVFFAYPSGMTVATASSAIQEKLVAEGWEVVARGPGNDTAQAEDISGYGFVGYYLVTGSPSAEVYVTISTCTTAGGC